MSLSICIWILHGVISLFTLDMVFYQVGLLLFYDVHTASLTFVGKIEVDIALRNSILVSDIEYHI